LDEEGSSPRRVFDKAKRQRGSKVGAGGPMLMYVCTRF
jgi:hypothetical protein